MHLSGCWEMVLLGHHGKQSAYSSLNETDAFTLVDSKNRFLLKGNREVVATKSLHLDTIKLICHGLKSWCVN